MNEPQQPRLLDQVCQCIRLKHMSLKTIDRAPTQIKLADSKPHIHLGRSHLALPGLISESYHPDDN